MDNNFKILSDIYKNTSMGINSIDKIEELCNDSTFLKVISEHKRELIDANDKARDKIREFSKEPKDISMLTKLSTDAVIKVETFLDSSTSKFA